MLTNCRINEREEKNNPPYLLTTASEEFIHCHLKLYMNDFLGTIYNIFHDRS